MVYIQSNKEKSLPHHFDCASAMYGAMDSALDFRLVSFEEVTSGKFDNLIYTNLFVGSVEFMREVFKRMGIEDPRLPLNSNRKHEIMKISEVRKKVGGGEKLFIKPLQIKLFTGFVCDIPTLNTLNGIDDELEVMVYEPFKSKIASEWRTYIWGNNIVEIKNYSGDLFKVPSRNYIETIIRENKDKFPRYYVIDVGVLENGEEVVIEYNDMWSIGNYGVPNDQYLFLLKDRYFDMIRQNI